MNLLALAILAAVITPIVVAMQRTHRRSRGIMPGPHGLADDSVLHGVRREVERDLLGREADEAPAPIVPTDSVTEVTRCSVELKGQRARLSPAL